MLLLLSALAAWLSLSYSEACDNLRRQASVHAILAIRMSKNMMKIYNLGMGGHEIT